MSISYLCALMDVERSSDELVVKATNDVFAIESYNSRCDPV